MNLDLGATYKWIVAELAQLRPVADSMTALIDKCESAVPHPDWAKLRALPYANTKPLLQWLQRPFLEQRHFKPLKGLWFGLFNPCPDGKNPVADIYVCGSERFDPDPLDNSWAVGPDWWPNARYADSMILADIYRIAFRQGASKADQNQCLGNNAEYPLVLCYSALVVRELLGQIDPSLILNEYDSVGVAVGFDSGDFVLLGHLTHSGLVPIAGTSNASESET